MGDIQLVRSFAHVVVILQIAGCELGCSKESRTKSPWPCRAKHNDARLDANCRLLSHLPSPTLTSYSFTLSILAAKVADPLAYRLNYATETSLQKCGAVLRLYKTQLQLFLGLVLVCVVLCHLTVFIQLSHLHVHIISPVYQ